MFRGFSIRLFMAIWIVTSLSFPCRWVKSHDAIDGFSAWLDLWFKGELFAKRNLFHDWDTFWRTFGRTASSIGTQLVFLHLIESKLSGILLLYLLQLGGFSLIQRHRFPEPDLLQFVRLELQPFLIVFALFRLKRRRRRRQILKSLIFFFLSFFFWTVHILRMSVFWSLRFRNYFDLF